MPTTVPHTGPYDTDFDDPFFASDLDTYDPGSGERSTAVIAHLTGLFGFLGPLLVWLLKRDDSAYVEDQAAEALNFQITLAIAAVVSLILCLVLVGFVLLFALAIAAFLLPIRAAFAANAGQRYRYPLTIRLIK